MARTAKELKKLSKQGYFIDNEQDEYDDYGYQDEGVKLDDFIERNNNAPIDSTTTGSASSDVSNPDTFAKFAEALDKAQTIKNNPFTAFGEIGQSIAKGISLLDPNGDNALLTTEQKINYANNNIANLSDENKNKLNEYNDILDNLDASRMSLTDNFNPEENERYAANSQRLKDLKASLQQDLNLDDETFNKYVSSSKFLKNLEDRQRQQEEYANASAGEKILTNIGDALLSPIRPYVTLKGYLDETSSPYYDENLGVDHNATGFDMANINRDIQTQATKDIAELTGADKEDASLGSKAANEVLKTLYTGVKSGADSMARLATGEVSTLLGAGIEAADQQYVDAGERGLTKAQAIGTAVSSGAAEAVFEKIPVDNMLKLWKNGAEGVAKGGVKAAVKEILQQAGLEGMEEVETDIANKFSDAIINKDKSEFNTQVEDYKAQGMDEAEAFGRTLLDNVADTVESFAGGAIGGLVGGGGAIAGSVATTKEAKKLDGNYREVAQAIPDNVEDYNSEEDYNKAMEVKARAEELDTQDKVSSADRSGLLQDIYAVNETMPNVDLIENINESVNSPFADVGGFQVAKNDITSQEVAQSMAQASRNNNVNDFVEAYRDSQASSNAEARQTGQQYFNTLSPKFYTYDEGSRLLDTALSENTADELYTMALNGEEVAPELLNTQRKADYYNQGAERRSNLIELQNQLQEQRKAQELKEKESIGQTKIKKVETPQGKADIADISINNDGSFVWKKGDEEVVIPKKDISDKAMQQYMEYATSQPTLRAKQLYADNYTGSMPIGNYNMAFTQAFNAGRGNSYRTFKQFNDAKPYFSEQIPVETLEAFYNEGKRLHDEESKKSTVNKDRRGKTVEKKGTGKVTYDKSIKKNDPIVKKAELIAKITGLDVEIVGGDIYEERNGEKVRVKGQFKPNLSKIIISQNTRVNEVLDHEGIGEFMEAYNPEDMKEIQDLLLNYLFETNASELQEEIDKMHDLYRKVNPDTSMRDAANEVVNNALSGVFSSEEGIQKLADYAYKNNKQSAFEKLVQFIKDLVNKIKSLVDNEGLNKQAERVAKMEQQRLEELQDKILNALTKARENYENTSVEGATEDMAASLDGTQYSLEKETLASNKNAIIIRRTFNDGSTDELIQLKKAPTLSDVQWNRLYQLDTSYGYGIDYSLNGKGLKKAVEDGAVKSLYPGNKADLKKMADILGLGEKEPETLEEYKPTDKYTEDQIEHYVEEAEDHFGTTENYSTAGYLDVNGELLDFSEGQNYRASDHREISEILDLPEDAGYSDGLIEFMAMGNIRMQEYGIDIAVRPNKEQEEVLRDFFDTLDGEVTVDFSKPNGDSAGSASYREGTSSTRILDDIDSYFNTLEVPEGTDDGNVYYSLDVDSEGEKLSEGQKKFFINSKATDIEYEIYEGETRLANLYHGTVREFYTFDKDYASVEGNVGAGFYFTNDISDVERNYASEDGADLTNKIEREADILEGWGDYEDLSHEEIVEKLRKKYITSEEPIVLEVYLNIQNPVYITTYEGKESLAYSDLGRQDTLLFTDEDLDPGYDVEDFESEEEYQEEVNAFIEEELQDIIHQVDNSEEIADVVYDAFYEGGITFEDLKKKLNNLYLEDEEGNFNAKEVARQLVEALGYDGIIDYTPYYKFRNMGVQSTTTHYIVFNSNQAKATSNENPTENEDIRYSLTTDNVREYTLEPNSVHSQYEVSEIWDSEELMDMSDAEEDAKKKQIADLIKDKGILSFEVTQQGKKSTIFVSENTRQGEGKYRATWFDDKGAIMHVARDSAEELAKEVLNDLSMTKPINIKAYREGDNDFRYSLDVPTTYALDLEEIFPGSEEATETLKYNKEAFVINMSAANKILDFDISDSQINELAEWLIKAYNSEETEERISKNLKGIFEGLKEGYFDDMANALMNLTEETARKAKEVDPDDQARYDSFISGMPKFYFSEEQRREADNMFGGWNAIGGTFANFSSFYRKDAPTLDGSTYWEICDNAQRHGYTMNREVSDLDQITEIKKALEYFEPQSKPMFEGATIEDASLSMAMEIMERYYGYALKENQSNANLSDLKADLRKQVADYKKAVGKQYQEQVKKYQQEIKDLKEKQKYAEQQGQQLYDRVVKAETEGGSTKKISKEEAWKNYRQFTKAIPKFRLTAEQRKQAIEDMGAWNAVWSRLKYVMNKNAPDLDENIYNKIVDLAKQYGFDGMSKDTDHMGKEIIKALDMIRNQTYQTNNKAVKDLSLANWQLDTDLQQAQRMALRDRNSLSRRIEREKRNKSLNSIKRDINRLIKMAYKPTKNKFIPDILKPKVVEMLNSLDLTVYRKRKDGTIIQSKNESKKVKEWRQNLEALNRLLRDIEEFREVDNKDMYRNDAQRNYIYNLSVTMGNVVNGFLGEFLDKTQGQDVKLTALSSQELEPFEKFLRSFVRSINKAQETYKNLAYKEVEDLAIASLNDMSKLRTFSAKGIPKVLHDFLNVSMLDPYTYFEELGDATKTLRDEFVEGTNQKLKRVFQSERAFDKKLKELKLTKKEISKWENNFSEYKGLQLSDTQKMYLYAVFPREQAVAHILVGGVVSDNPNKHNKKYKRNINPTHLTSEDVRKITDTLTDKQKALSDYMVDYLTNTVSEWGNNVSNALYGLDMFTESHYMPIKTDSNTNKTDVGNAKDQANIWSLQNNSATKSLVENANNALVLTDIFDVFSDHIATMAAYEGYVLPINDAMKYYNYSDTQYFKGAETAKRKDLTIKRAIDRVLGEKGKDYFLRFIERVNGDTTNKDDLSGINKLFAKNKAQAVLANLRVVIQQPTAYVRALDVIENKYLVKAFSLNPVKLKKYADTSKRKSPLAMYKSKGYYDTSIGQSVRQMITGAYTTKEKINEKAGALAGLADDITWGALYRAAELKIADTTDATKDPDFDKKVLDLFNEIILKTQVVDTVMSKSQLMSNPDRFHRLMTAFMAEPTKTYNMLHRAWMQGHQTKNWKKFRKALVIYAYNQVLVAIAQSIVDAWRDDEDDRPYVDRFLDALFSTTAFSEAETLNDYWKALASANIVDTLNPFNLLPFVKDISSAAQGFDNGNMATQAIYDVVAYIQEIDKLAEGKSTKTPYGFAYKTAQILSVATGVPVASAMREVKDLYNNVNDFWDGENLIRTEKNESAKAQIAKSDNIQETVKTLYQEKVQENLEKGKTQQEAEKAAKSSVGSAITGAYKNDLVEAKKNNMSEATSMKAEAIKGFTALGISQADANKRVEKWFK